MTKAPGLLRYVSAAFNARPFGMVVAPNWVGLVAMGVLGLANPGFWVLGAGLELGYLLLLSTNERFRRTVAVAEPAGPAVDDWTARTARALLGLGDHDRLQYQSIAERCRSVLDLQAKPLVTGTAGLEAQEAGLARLAWMYLRLLLARQSIEKVRATGASTRELPDALAAIERRLADDAPGEELRRSLEGQADILRQRINHRREAERQMVYLESELARIEQQVELIREQAALSTDPAMLSNRIDEIASTLGGTSQWMRDQQQLLGAMDDLLIDAVPPLPLRGKEIE